MDLNNLREQIDIADDELIRTFRHRMALSAQIAEYKKEHGLIIYDAARERQKLSDICEKSGEDLYTYTSALYSLVFELSRSYQNKIINEPSDLMKQILFAIEKNR